MPVNQKIRGAASRAALTRRGVLKGAAAAGLAAPLAGLAGPNAGMAAVARQTNNGSTLIVGLDGSPSDLDPQSQYDYRSVTVVRSLYEGLVGLKGSATDEYDGLVAESWESMVDDGWYAFNDVHAMMAFVGGGRWDLADRQLATMVRSLERDGSNQAMTGEVGLPVARAIYAFGRGDHGAAIDLLRPLTSSAALERVHAAVRARVPALEHDRPAAPDLAAITELIAQGDLERACAVNVN